MYNEFNDNFVIIHAVQWCDDLFPFYYFYKNVLIDFFI